jgi:hypothetical protein
MRRAAQYRSFLHLVFWILPILMGLEQLGTLNEKERQARAAVVTTASSRISHAPVTPASFVPELATLDTLLPVPEGFVGKAKVNYSYTYGPEYETPLSLYRRRLVVIVTPPGASETEVDTELRAVARREYGRGALTVRVVALPPNGTGREAGKLLFAPHGSWDKTDRVYGIDEYEAVITR